MVEGGSRILQSFLHERLVDWILVTIAPRYLAGKPTLNGRSSSSLPAISALGTTRAGEDVLIWGRPEWA
jgi:riboflavin biosynthesis pyrimidine reductase